MVNSSKQRNRKHAKKQDDSIQPHKDRFIDLAQAALEEADIEEDRKGVIHEVMEALIAKTGAPLVAEVISEQLRSQDVIEKIAEHHEEERIRLNSSPSMTRIDSTDSINSLKEPEVEFDEQLNPQIESNLSPEPTITIIAEYLWRLFRVLLLSSLVGLVYHFQNV
ncbi:hypothetical protein BD770DRAFT_17542 [Pilaira anomala]|nr:hypothetical protein BD770DRAFT_17542 [Pilaira anomala]